MYIEINDQKINVSNVIENDSHVDINTVACTTVDINMARQVFKSKQKYTVHQDNGDEVMTVYCKRLTAGDKGKLHMYFERVEVEELI